MQYVPTTKTMSHIIMVLGSAAGLIGGALLIAWIFGLPNQWAAAGAITVKTNSCLALLLAGASMVLLELRAALKLRQLLVGVVAATVLLIGALTLSEHVVGWDLGIDQLLATEIAKAPATLSPNRMGLPAAIAFTLVGAGLLALAAQQRRIVAYAALGTLLVILVPLVGFFYGVEEFYGNARVTSIAWPTIVAMLCLGAGLLLKCTDIPPLAMLLRSDEGGKLLRTMLPATILLPLILGFLCVLGQSYEWFSTAFGTGLLMTVVVLTFSTMLSASAHRLSCAEHQHRLQEMELHRERAVLSGIMNSTDVMLVYLDLEFNFRAVNPAYAATCKMKPEEMLGRNHFVLYPNEENEAIFRRVRDTGVAFTVHDKPFEFPDQPERGVTYWDWSLTPVRGVNGAVEGLVFSLRETTERKRIQIQLEQAKVAAEHASRAKDQFIAVLSHELRTPLTPAVAALSLLLTDDRLPGDVQQDLRTISRNIDLEVRLIADLLDISRINSGKLHLDKRPTDVASAIREAAITVDAELKAKGQSIHIETPGAPYMLPGDAARLQQVFWNLLRNSVKFSPAQSPIIVRARVMPAGRCPMFERSCQLGIRECPNPEMCKPEDPAGALNLVVEVIDRGSGIAPEVFPKLFRAFEQEQKARTFGGLGLGLSICKAVVEMHGGSISAHSQGEGCGSTFVVRLPVGQCHEGVFGKTADPGAALDGERLPGKKGFRIVLVEDHADTSKLISRLLVSEGHDVIVAASVSEGLAAIRLGKPDLLISDLGLPDGNGLDLMERIAGEGIQVPAIALSGYGTADDIERSKAAGFAEHLVKPLSSVEVLTTAIQRHGPAGRRGELAQEVR